MKQQGLFEEGASRTEEEGGAGAEPPQPHLRKNPERFGPIMVLAAALYELFQLVASIAKNDDEAQLLSEYWDEHKHRIERILRMKGPKNG